MNYTLNYTQIFLIGIFVFVVGSILVFRPKDKFILRIALTIPIAIGYVIASIFLITIGLLMEIYIGFLTLGLFTVIVLAILRLVWGKFGKKSITIYSILVFVLLISIGARAGYNKYIKNITVDERNYAFHIKDYRDGTKKLPIFVDEDFKFENHIPTLDGATAFYPVYRSIALSTYGDKFNEDYIKWSKTPFAYKNIVNKTVDMIFVLGPSKEQQEFARENNVTLNYTPIGKETFVFFVNKDSVVDDLTIDDIKNIYSGRVSSWDELGFKGLGEIKAYQRNEGSGSQTALLELMNGEKLKEPEKEKRVSSMEGIVEEISSYKNYKNSIGFTFRYYSTEMLNNKNIKLLKINGVAPTRENIENGTYPIIKEFYAVTRSDADEDTLKLLEWIKSNKGKKIIDDVGYVSY